MLASIIARFNAFFERRRIGFFIVLFSLIGILSVGISKLQISESIFSTLPKGENFDEFNQLISNKNLSNQVVFSFSIPSDAETSVIKEQIDTFADSLSSSISATLLSLSSPQEDTQEALYQYTFEHFPTLIDSGYYDYIKHKIERDTLAQSLAQTRTRLASPEGMFLKQFLLNDPLGLTFPYFSQLRKYSNTEAYDLEDGIIFTNNRSNVLLFGGTTFDTGNSGASSELYLQLEAFKKHWNQNNPNYTFQYFGTFAIAAQNAIQIKQDSVLTLVIALVIIVSLLWYFYRKITTPLFILLPAAFGGLFALGMIGFIKPQVSGIAMATGAVLLGIALDYSIHFFTHLRHVRSIEQTLKDITAPLLTGSLTTILAYSALNFANSEILQDFGLFAGFALSGALFFTLTFLPILIRIFGLDYTTLPELKPLFRIPELPTKWQKPFLGAVLAITLFLYYQSKQIQFDGELQNLSFITPEMAEMENQLTQINPEKEGKIFLFASANTANEAARVNEELQHKLALLQDQGQIKFFTSTAPFIMSDSLRNARQAMWDTFWAENNRRETLLKQFHAESSQLGFSKSAFENFEQLITGPPTQPLPADSLLQLLNLTGFKDSSGANVTYITTVVAEKERLKTIKSSLQAVEGATVFHRAEMAESLLALVQDDFNYTLLISASIVFIALLLLYGRIELAFLSFLPMAISWIWILGLTSLLGIQFNFVNVVFATFIFGLGDDFSIFMTDGILHRYKYGRDNMQSYQSAISLSGITVIIGTGVLLLASHPALRSIAVVSVPGIICIVFVSLFVQPLLFNLFVQNRVNEGRTPLTLYTFLKTWIDFLFFASMCYFGFFVMVFIHLLPISRARKKRCMTYALHKLSIASLFFGIQLRKKSFDLHNKLNNQASIVIANHASFLDTMIVLWQYPKAVLMVKEWVYKSPLYGWVIRYADYIYMEEGPDANLEQAKRLAEQGYTIIIFPEGTRSANERIQRFHKGAFLLAEQLQLPIQPMLIHGAYYGSPKGELSIKPSPINVKILPAIQPTDYSWGSSYQERSKSISAYFKKEYQEFKKERDDTQFLKQKIFHNYIYKGPILEWYFKIKWEFEKKHYETYDQLIGTRKHILDLGCGYGFLDFYLHYRDENRLITGVDYDEEKIKIAANSYAKTENLQFIHGDIATFEITPHEVIFLHDVLHYLPKEQQVKVLENCIHQLAPNGILFIRDGITDNKEGYKNTKLTEFFSTKVVGFNKKDQEFHFFSKKEMEALAVQHQLSCEMHIHSKNTSNVLFILRKPTL